MGLGSDDCWIGTVDVMVVCIMMFQKGGGLTEGTNLDEKKKDNGDKEVDTSVSRETIRKSCANDYVHPNQFYLVGFQEDDTSQGYFLCKVSFFIDN